MRTITKQRPPRSLTEYSKTANATYKGYRDKQDLRETLVAEQRGLCCYCTNRIVATDKQMKIEHWRSQTKYPEDALKYANLLGACPGGGPGQPPHLQHCDASKRDRDLSRNPANPDDRVEQRVSFRSDGRVRSQEPDFDRELNDVLNLNNSLLVEQRVAIWAAIAELIAYARDRGHNRPQHVAMLKKELVRLRAALHPQPFDPVRISMIEDKLARRGNTRL